MMREDHWTARLSEYLDGELEGEERAACAAHLERCPECAGTLRDLRDLTRNAAALPDVEPPSYLWRRIEERLEPRRGDSAGAGAGAATERADGVVVSFRPRRRVAMTVPQLIAAGIALVLFSAGGAYLALTPPLSSDRAVVATPGGAATPQDAAAPVHFTAQYDALVTELEAEFLRRRDELDPETVRVVEQNLVIIERAIAEARQALEDDPSSGFLNAHLASTMRRKVDLLRQAAVIERTES